MTLDAAIKHAKEVGEKLIENCDTKQCGLEHLQLAKWLEELKRYRIKAKKSNNIDDVFGV